VKARPKKEIFAKSGGRCIYCGGDSQADTIDHMPPKILFKAKIRPKGLEFASCAKCNHGAKHSDLVVALLGRCYPNIQHDEVDELTKILSGVRNNIPGLHEEMKVDPASEVNQRARLGITSEKHNFVSMDGPISMRHLRAFGARFGLAMHFYKTGKILPHEGGASARIYSNIDLVTGVVDEQLLKMLPPPLTLAAGKNSVESQFLYSAQKSDNDEMVIAFATFRMSFGLMAATANDWSKLTEPDFPPEAFPLRPGFLKEL
jgi:hypothetical protein